MWKILQAKFEQRVAAGEEGNTALAEGVLAAIVLWIASFNIGWTPLQVVYIAEILPFTLRARVRYCDFLLKA